MTIKKNELREKEVEKLDLVENELFGLLNSFIPLTYAGKVIFDQDNIGGNQVDVSEILIKPKKVPDVIAKCQVVDRILKVMERRTKLLGLDNVAIQDNGTGNIVNITLSEDDKKL